MKLIACVLVVVSQFFGVAMASKKPTLESMIRARDARLDLEIAKQESARAREMIIIPAEQSQPAQVMRPNVIEPPPQINQGPDNECTGVEKYARGAALLKDNGVARGYITLMRRFDYDNMPTEKILDIVYSSKYKSEEAIAYVAWNCKTMGFKNLGESLTER